MIQRILENLKIAALNEMQLASIEANKAGTDIVLLSPTGSGKTLAFLLPVVSQLDNSIPTVQVMILAPSRELAIQIEQVFRSMGTEFKVNCCYGGHPMKVEINNLKHPPAVLIGTPGRIADHMRRGTFDTDTIQTIILDEFDKSLEFGFQEEMSFIISELYNLKKRILTSASEAIAIPEFAGVTSPLRINYLSDSQPKGLKLKAVTSEGRDKLEALFSLICHLGNSTTLIFCNHREAVERISELLYDKGLVHGIYHGGLEQEERERALIKFRNGSHQILITTDLASRGLDIPEIENVIHYQFPTTADAYMHRNGRTARMHAEGTAYLIMGEGDHLPAFLKEKPEYVKLDAIPLLPENSKWDTLFVAAGKKDKINKTDIVGLLIQKGKLHKDEIGLIEVLDYSSFVAVKREKINKVVQLLRFEKIKKKSVKIEVSI
ncbi:MAG: DEAD/DEAH box helicase [Bacteroidales bacterium]|nr:DEAD/DEAH box helicase [Bacteroidales bacterium]